MELRDEEVVSVGGRFFRIGELMPFLDAQLFAEAQEFAGFSATAQAVLDEYLRLFARRKCGAESAA